MKFERDGRTWHWPDSDKKLIQVFDWVRDIDTILRLVDNTSICVQAGGAMGQWPIYYSDWFGEVYTFEPNPENFKYLMKNIEEQFAANVIINDSPLDKEQRIVSLDLDDSENGNSGAYYTIPGSLNSTAKWSTTIDLLNLDDCGLIQLDIEGYEYNALLGGERTIKEYKPVIVIEEKQLPHMKPGEHLKARQLLESWGYKEVGRVHRDVIFKCD